MSKNITIQEGGVAKQLTVDKLKTDLVGGGTCLWVPEDETTLGTKVITENGTYKASEDGYYGYSEVTVSGIGTATGTGPDGETHSYEEDGEGGVTDTILPDSIAVVTPPTVTTYADGDTIDFDGIVVKAYLKSGSIWSDSAHPGGIINQNELIFPVTVADAGQTTDISYVSPSGEVSVGNQTFQGPVYAMPGSLGQTREVNPGASFTTVEDGTVFGHIPVTVASEVLSADVYFTSGTHRRIYVAYSTGVFLLVCDSQFSCGWGGYTPHNPIVPDPYSGYPQIRISGSLGSSASYTYDGKTAHYAVFPKDSILPTVTTSPNEIRSKAAIIAWYILHGDMQPIGGKQEIPVQWTRPRDGKTLESSFDITVVQ